MNNCLKIESFFNFIQECNKLRCVLFFNSYWKEKEFE